MPTVISARNYSNTTPPTNLTANVDNDPVNTTNIPVASTAGYPTPPFTGCFERNTNNQEFCLVTSIIDANHFRVVRGYDGTPAINHLAPATFEHCTGAIDFREANQHHTDTTRDDHLQYALVNGSRPITGLQTFSAGINAQTVALSGIPGYSYYPTRYVGGFGPAGHPIAGTWLAGDWGFDTTGCRWTCIVAGTPGLWAPESGHLFSRVYGPASTIVITNRNYPALVYNFSVIQGISYVIDVRVQGTIQTTDPVWVNSTLLCSPADMMPGGTYVMSVSGAAYYPGNVVQGSSTFSTNPAPSSGNRTFTVYVAAAGAGHYQLTPYSIELIIRRA